jgi:hypothetical protein
MRRSALVRVLLLLALPGVGSAIAAIPARAASPSAARHAAGRVTFVGLSSFTIQTGGRRVGRINALTAAANRITARDYPYVWGGGHGAAGVPSIGTSWRGNSRTRFGYDCSGAVAAVLAGAGLWPAGTPVPNDAGVISYLLRRRLIAPGPASAPTGVTLYDHPGIHIFMNINGRFWGTSDGQEGADPAGGAGWLSDAALDAHSKQFLDYHVLSGVLEGASTGQAYTFQFESEPLLALGLFPGDAVRIGYDPSSIGTMNAMAVSYTDQRTATGTLVAAAQDGSSFTLMSRDGTSTTYETGGDAALTQRLALGDFVSVEYTSTPSPTVADMAPAALMLSGTRADSLLVTAPRAVTVAHSVQVRTPAGAAQVSGTVAAIASERGSFTLRTASGHRQVFSTTGATLPGVIAGAAVTVDFVQATGGVPVAEQVLPGPPTP